MLSAEFWEEQYRKLFEVLARNSAKAARAGLKDGAEQLGIEIDFSLLNEYVVAWVQANCAEVARTITKTSMDAFIGKYEEWATQGAPLRSLIKELKENYGHKAKVIAVTETTRAFAYGNLAVFRHEGVEAIRWNTAEDELVCEICAPLAGTTAAMSVGFPEGIVAPPAHPNCRCWITPVIPEREAISGEELEAEELAIEEN